MQLLSDELIIIKLVGTTCPPTSFVDIDQTKALYFIWCIIHYECGMMRQVRTPPQWCRSLLLSMTCVIQPIYLNISVKSPKWATSFPQTLLMNISSNKEAWYIYITSITPNEEDAGQILINIMLVEARIYIYIHTCTYIHIYIYIHI